jgi:hypothetical protein
MLWILDFKFAKLSWVQCNCLLPSLVYPGPGLMRTCSMLAFKLFQSSNKMQFIQQQKIGTLNPLLRHRVLKNVKIIQPCLLNIHPTNCAVFMLSMLSTWIKSVLENDIIFSLMQKFPLMYGDIWGEWGCEREAGRSVAWFYEKRPEDASDFIPAKVLTLHSALLWTLTYENVQLVIHPLYWIKYLSTLKLYCPLTLSFTIFLHYSE